MKSVITCAAFLIWPSLVCADGFFVWKNQQRDIHEPQQKALIIHDAGWEDLVLSVRFQGAPEEFGWIVPLPALPEMEPRSPRIFEVLSQATQTPWFGRTPGKGMFMEAGSSVQPKVVTERVGIYTVSLLEGGTTEGVMEWLDREGFDLPTGADPVLTDYLESGWIFAAMRITLENQAGGMADSLANGMIQPIHFRFPAEHPVFPLKISSLGGGESEVLLYLLSRPGWVPHDAPGMLWESHCWSQIPWGWFRYGGEGGGGIPFLSGLADRFAAVADSMVLTKARAIVKAADMDDVGFGPYPALALLQDGDLRQRAEAATFIGRKDPPGGYAALETFLDRVMVAVDPAKKDFTGNGIVESHNHDVTSALWAAGRFGGERAVPLLSRWAVSDNLEWQTEALIGLIATDPVAATPICRDQFVANSHRDAHFPYEVERFLELCVAHLVEYGTDEELSAMKALAEANHDPRSWDRKWLSKQGNEAGLESGQTAVLIAAALGDEGYVAELGEHLRKFEITRRGASGSRRLDYYFRNQPWNRSVKELAFFLRNGLLVDRMVEVFSGRPALRDSLFRAVAHEGSPEQIPDDYRATLLARVSRLTSEDVALLVSIWEKAWTRLFGASEEENDQGEGEIASVDAMGKALAAQDALGIQGEVQALEELWEQVPWAEFDLKRSLVISAAIKDDPAACPMVMDYLNHDWAVRLASWDSSADLAQREFPANGWPGSWIFQIRTDDRNLGSFLARTCSDDVRALARDPAAPAILRMFCLIEFWMAWPEQEGEYLELMEGLQEEFPPGPLRDRIAQRLHFWRTVVPEMKAASEDW
ncbi:DUF2330 domain-containing protein [bacterium]|nr:DUF2330 domain-containing protein [bacterium]